eukprot:scaffold292433_cov19-Tisochrysis_lutea.AAC.1
MGGYGVVVCGQVAATLIANGWCGRNDVGLEGQGQISYKGHYQWFIFCPLECNEEAQGTAHGFILPAIM